MRKSILRQQVDCWTGRIDPRARVLEGVEGRGADFGRGSQVYLIVGHLPLSIAYRSQSDLLENVIVQIEALSGAPLERDNIAERIVSSHFANCKAGNERKSRATRCVRRRRKRRPRAQRRRSSGRSPC